MSKRSAPSPTVADDGQNTKSKEPSKPLKSYLESKPDTDPPGAAIAAGQTKSQNPGSKDMSDKLREWDALWDEAAKH